MKSKYICYHSILDFIVDFNALQLAMATIVQLCWGRNEIVSSVSDYMELGLACDYV